MEQENLIPQEGGEMTEEQMRADLTTGRDQVVNKERELNASRIFNKNSLKEEKMKSLKQLFEMMEDNGVDPTNLESIGEFVQKLEKENPDLAIMFEKAFSELSNIEGEGAIPAEAGMMGKFNNLQKGLLMPQGGPTPTVPAGPVGSTIV